MGRISTLPLNIPHQTDELYEKLLVAKEDR